MQHVPYTVVLGIDKKTIESLKLVWPTWQKHKPSLMSQRFIIFYNGVSRHEIAEVIGHAFADYQVDFVAWPPPGVAYYRDGLTKWTNPQRACMLAGFVHIPAWTVQTPYWLKVDVDAIATGKDDWVDPSWFNGNPSIIAPGWHYTKPADQLLIMDDWVDANLPRLLSWSNTRRLNAVPELGSDLVRYPRIASWCAFFSTEFTKLCSQVAGDICGQGQLPIDSQDGYLFYMAHRGGFAINKVRMKRYGWTYRSSLKTVSASVQEALQ